MTAMTVRLRKLRTVAAFVTALGVIGAVAIAGDDEIERRKATEKTVAGLVEVVKAQAPRLDKLDRNQVLLDWCSKRQPPIPRHECPTEK